MLSVILTSYKEEKTIAKAIECLIDPDYTGYTGGIELLTVIPDEATLEAAKEAVEKLGFKHWINIKDPLRGKPYALNLALEKAKGDVLLLTDGDVYLGKDSIKKIIEHFDDDNVGGVTGRPISSDDKNKFMGYIGHLLADAAHHKRQVTMSSSPAGKSLKIVSRSPHFFVLSGYILAMKNIDLRVPSDSLVEDAYLSYELHNKGYQLIYEPEATVYVKYAQTIKDWYLQKLRSVGGYVQLWKYEVIKKDTKVRNFWKELEYFWFPLKYATNAKELFWSLILYPMRLVLWIWIFYQQRIKKRNLAEGWERIESTK
ncbi:glycosyltransferase [Candidatus Dojkabacteria bacterium]|uniref:Glycosyltransferase n=1 Tax=Candidatus Dojkabacteria bacterium TaxID=2099670 RepID=A0A955L6X1_9BACT|nr:glycosyltransferase [Candidatus Dojkabacteria bacterium]